ncbi:MAG: endolytic transglycosylase MltG [Synergistaceae bacterium]|jgi:UPF0755 protein|nr:endolytic transglycosylase MltG [Synergistaceae bacterium]
MRGNRLKRLKAKERELLLFFVPLLLGLGLGLAAFYFKIPYKFWNDLLPIPHGEMKLVVIKPGLTARQCAQAFYDQEALTDPPSALADWMRKLGIDRKIRSGQYRVHRSGAWDMARQLMTARAVDWSFTIVPWMDIFSLRDVFTEENNPVSSDLSGDLARQALLNDGNYPEPMRPCLPVSEEERIAFLLPETYFVAEETPAELVKVASHTWWDRFGERASLLTSKDLTEKATVASMVQREALWDEERPIIAGVIANRLEKGMPLQVDATVVYAWKLLGKKLTRVLYSDLTLDSPYNTYLAPGLPPAPICIPSSESWESAFSPQNNRYYYYVARKDGYHHFAETYKKHRDNIKKARSE